MPYRARFSRTFLKKEERLPSDVKPRVVEALREILMSPHIGDRVVVCDDGSTDMTAEIVDDRASAGL